MVAWSDWADSFHGSGKRFRPLQILRLDPGMSPPYKLFVRDTPNADDFAF